MTPTEPASSPDWSEMDANPRRSLAALTKADIPDWPGVYALYRNGRRVYVGKAAILRDRIWKNHCGRGAVMTGSALRRNIAEHLGIALAAEIKARRYQPTAPEVAAVRGWLDGCDIAWIECATDRAAAQLEDAFKREDQPLLTKR